MRVFDLVIKKAACDYMQPHNCDVGLDYPTGGVESIVVPSANTNCLV